MVQRTPLHASVIVAVRDAEARIEACIDSLLQLDYPRDRLELIVVDNGSRDATPQLLAGYASEIALLREERPGPAAARNTGLRHARGKVVAFTDADCIVDRGWLSRIIVPLGNREVGVVGGRNRAHRPRNSIARFGERVHDHRRAIQDCVPPYAITMNWASRRGVLEEAGLFDPDLVRCSDVDMALRLIQAGYRLVYEPSAVVYHCNRDTLKALLRQGYDHGYHAAAIQRRHALFLESCQNGRGALTRNRRAPQPLYREAASEGYAHSVWAVLFEAAKRVGRMRAAAGGARPGAESEA